MQKATFKEFSKVYDDLKSGSACALTNIFQFGSELQNMLERKECLMHCAHGALFLLMPSHDIYYECFFAASDMNNLSAGLKSLLSVLPETHFLRSSIIGKEPQAGAIYQIFAENNFSLVKKLMRMKLKKTDKRILEAMRPYTEEYRDCISYAKEGDEDEIYEILHHNFDTVGDNIPDKIDIKHHITQNNIVILRQNEKIAALHYFNVHGNILHSLYDVTRKEYRGGNGFFMALAYFVHEDFFKRGKIFKRALGWRDATAKKLLKHAKENNQTGDGVFIYNMLHKPTPIHNV